jgi:phosphoglycerol transferase
LVLVLGILDQTSPSAGSYEQYEVEYRADAEFVSRIEACVPAGTMIFQLPYARYVEHGPINGVRPYDMLRPYLHSRQLRWSYGAMGGREGDLWQRETVRKSMPEMLARISAAGFGGIYLDRFGFVDGGAAESAGLRTLLGAPLAISPNGRLEFFTLERLQPQASAGFRVRPCLDGANPVKV